MNYKVGDKVKIVKNIGSSWYDQYIGVITTIVKIAGDRYILSLHSSTNDRYSSWDLEEFKKVDRLYKLKRILSHE